MINLEIRIPQIASQLPTYNQLKVYRSIAAYGEDYEWEELTGSSHSSASFSLDVGTMVSSIGGLVLTVGVDRLLTYNVTFDEDVYTTTRLSSTLRTLLTGVASVVVDGTTITITSYSTGRASALQVGGTACNALGLVSGTMYSGKSRRYDLYPDITIYPFVDLDGVDGDSYAYSLYHSVTGIESDKEEIHVSSLVMLPSEMSACNIVLVNGAGFGVPDVAVTFYPISRIVGSNIISDRPVAAYTNSGGACSVDLIRGCMYSVVIGNTNFVRRFTVPLQESFNLSDLVTDADDAFDVRVPDDRIWLVSGS